MSELIQTKLNLYLPNDDVVREKRPYNIFKKYPNLVIVSLTHPSIGKEASFNLKRSIYFLNYADSPEDCWDIVQREINVVTIDNVNFSLTFLSYGPDAPINTTGYNYYRSYPELYNAVILKLSSPELLKRFPNLELAILCNPAFLMKQLSEVKSIENGRIPLEYYFKGGGLYIDKLRLCFEKVATVNRNQDIIRYSKKRSEGKFVSRKKLIPGNLYTTSRTDCGNFFLYLGEFDNCPITHLWSSNHVLNWENPYETSFCPNANINEGSLKGSLVIEFPYYGLIDFRLKERDYLTFLESAIYGHNVQVKMSPFKGYNFKIVPDTSRLRGIEIDTFLKVNSSTLPKDIIKNYVFDNIHNKVYDFIGYNIMSSLIWDDIKGNKDYVNFLVDRFAYYFLQQKNSNNMDFTKIKDSFVSSTGLPGHLFDDSISKLENKHP